MRPVSPPRAAAHGAAALLAASILAAPWQGKPASAPGDKPSSAVAPLEAAARSLARAGRHAEALETAEVLASLGQPADANARLRSALAQEAAKPAAAAGKGALPDAVRALRAAAKELGRAAAAAPEAEGRRLAEACLRIDADSAEARRVLGHEKLGSAWASPEDRALGARRASIATAVQHARRIEIAVETRASEDPVARAALVRPATEARWKGLAVHTPFGPEKSARILRETVRALALSQFLRTGELVPPEALRSRWVLVELPDEYQRAVAEARRSGAYTNECADEAAKIEGYYYEGLGLFRGVMEGEIEGVLLKHLSGLQHQCAPLAAGHLHWVCMTYLGTGLTRTVWTEAEAGPARPADTSADPNDATAERRSMMRLANAGIAGCRAWMAYLAARREDPPWSRSMVEVLGKVAGMDLLKSTSVVEYLQELGALEALLKATDPEASAANRKDPAAAIERALGEAIARFEVRWRRWVAPASAGVLQRLEAKATAPVSRGEAEALAHLNGLRQRALARDAALGTGAVEADRGLGEGARLHARYLVKHPEQAAAWPDAHEEYPDREGFTAEGAWAGTHGVIAPGVGGAREALDLWMATFYHRLPLLDPGLTRIGWALEGKVAVLDCVSMVSPPERAFEVVWPPDGAEGIPARFAPELPSPVPGADQGTFGYPVTLQLGLADRDRRAPEIALTLRARDEKGPVVESWVSTPTQPTNQILAPPETWCLIPKNPLLPKTRYVATARWGEGGRTLSWSFTTR